MEHVPPPPRATATSGGAQPEIAATQIVGGRAGGSGQNSKVVPMYIVSHSPTASSVAAVCIAYTLVVPSSDTNVVASGVPLPSGVVYTPWRATLDGILTDACTLDCVSAASALHSSNS